MAGRGRSAVQRLVQQHTAARAFSAVRTPQFASAVEASGLQGTAASANSSSALLAWRSCPCRLLARPRWQQRPRCALHSLPPYVVNEAVTPLAAQTARPVRTAQPINLATAPLPPAKLDYQVVFVLGGPGSGKGTQCAKLVEEFGLVHLSAGDLLRAHMKSGTEDGNMVAAMIKQGQIVPSRVTISLLEAAMRDSGKRRFLIDGFPRNEENRSNFETQTGIQPAFVLFFDCPEEVMERRLLGRQEGRTDDNLETIRKRFKVFMDSTLPIINFYEAKGRVRSINADRSPDVVYADVRKLFAELNGM